MRIRNLVIGAGVVVAGLVLGLAAWQGRPAAPRYTVLGRPRADAVPADMTAVAWISDGRACYGSAEVGNVEHPEPHHCVDMPARTGNPATPTLWTKPHFLGLPYPPDGESILAVGFVSGSVASVDVRMTSGVHESATVVPLRGARAVGGYAVWLPVGASQTISWADIAAVFGRDSSGRVVARLGQR